jgi:ubiquinone/menaquinone biosynthesis C-methylase UbiE
MQASGPRPKPPAKPHTHWSDVGEWYDGLVGDEGSEFHREVVIPGVLKLLGQVAQRTVLDVACGQGVLSRKLALHGAKVTAVDAAESLIEAARGRGGEGIIYLKLDAEDLRLPGAEFDSAACVLAIQNMANPQGAFTSVGRVLKPGGVFVVVMMHPSFRSPKTTHWGWDPEAGVQYRRVDRYLSPRKEPIVTHPGIKDGSYTWSFHRPIGEYVGFARKAGMLVDAIEEWASHKNSDSGPRAAAENTARKEIPMFLAMRCVKQ